MKKFLIYISLVLLAAMQFITNTAFAESEISEEDFLDAIGIISMDENYKSDAEVSRIEFVKAVFKVVKTDFKQHHTEDMQPFFDVTKDDEFFLTANIAYNMGIIKGDTDGFFRPYATISSDEAITILLRALYGSDMVENLGGAEVLATKLGLYKNLKVDATRGFTYNNLAVLIYNALTADFIATDYVGSYYFAEDKTLLSELYDIGYVEGIVDGNYKKSIYSEPTKYNYITVNGELFKLGYEKYNDLYFGQNVTVYYTGDSSEELVILYIEEERNSIAEIDFDDLESLNPDKLVYTEQNGRKVKEAKLSRTCISIHNNSRINLTKSFDVSGNGSVVCIDNDDDGYIDILDITTYDIYLVKYVNTKYEQIMFENSDTIISLDDYGDCRIVDTEGNNLELGNISENNVLEISISEDKKFITITVVSDKVSFTVSQVYRSDEDDFAVIQADDGTEYRTVKGFSEDIRVGTTYTFALDSQKNIFSRIGDSESTYKIGYVIFANLSEDDSSVGYVKIIGTDEKKYILTVSEKVVCLNYDERLLTKDAIKILQEPQLIRFSEKDGIMKAFEIASDDENYDGLQKLATLPDANNAYTRYWKNAELIGGRIAVNNDTIIIRQDDLKSPTDESAYSFEKITDLLSGWYYPSTTGYRVGNSDIYADVLFMAKKVELIKTSPIMLISKIQEKYDNKREEVVKVFKGFVKNQEVEFVLSENELAYYKTVQGEEIELGVGDCIRYAIDNKNEIVLVKLIFDYSEMKMYGNNDGDDSGVSYGNENLHRTGVVEYVRDNFVKIAFDGLSVPEDYLCSLNNTGVYQVSVQKGRIVCEPITAFDIMSLETNPDLKDKAFVRMHQGETGVLVIYRAD